MGILTPNISCNPYTGVRKVNGKLKVSEDKKFKHFFTGTNRLLGVTQGKIYDVVAIEGHGECEDVIFIDDFGNRQRLGDSFFEEIEV